MGRIQKIRWILSLGALGLIQAGLSAETASVKGSLDSSPKSIVILEPLFGATSQPRIELGQFQKSFLEHSTSIDRRGGGL